MKEDKINGKTTEGLNVSFFKEKVGIWLTINDPVKIKKKAAIEGDIMDVWNVYERMIGYIARNPPRGAGTPVKKDDFQIG